MSVMSYYSLETAEHWGMASITFRGLEEASSALQLRPLCLTLRFVDWRLDDAIACPKIVDL